ncbi:uncharacterized protein LY79DRAFT_124828 [Colletotrichum navitas]|uniref:Uncharacterized protein n=1 Tax=Colletotrichum navitas TaxID=681940 RepID=A0AAD8V6F7_9PEZI|nr:uncharacterized protein LY79DRAFT_124828 [Colletotrichum navitas]KAK1594769.1 hypothetical protein LY79DRAFT_124828 [Colletotrichum navitas]
MIRHIHSLTSPSLLLHLPGPTSSVTPIGPLSAIVRRGHTRRGRLVSIRIQRHHPMPSSVCAQVSLSPLSPDIGLRYLSYLSDPPPPRRTFRYIGLPLPAGVSPLASRQCPATAYTDNGVFSEQCNHGKEVTKIERRKPTAKQPPSVGRTGQLAAKRSHQLN